LPVKALPVLRFTPVPTRWKLRFREPSLTVSLTAPAATRFVLSVTTREVTLADSGVSADAAATT
jgi:hypothetical protein